MLTYVLATIGGGTVLWFLVAAVLAIWELLSDLIHVSGRVESLRVGFAELDDKHRDLVRRVGNLQAGERELWQELDRRVPR